MASNRVKINNWGERLPKDREVRRGRSLGHWPHQLFSDTPVLPGFCRRPHDPPWPRASLLPGASEPLLLAPLLNEKCSRETWRLAVLQTAWPDTRPPGRAAQRVRETGTHISIAASGRDSRRCSPRKRGIQTRKRGTARRWEVLPTQPPSPGAAGHLRPPSSVFKDAAPKRFGHTWSAPQPRACVCFPGGPTTHKNGTTVSHQFQEVPSPPDLLSPKLGASYS